MISNFTKAELSCDKGLKIVGEQTIGRQPRKSHSIFHTIHLQASAIANGGQRYASEERCEEPYY